MAPSTVAQSTRTLLILDSTTRMTFYANGRHWVFFQDGLNENGVINYATSIDGSIWSAKTFVRIHMYLDGFSVWFDGEYVHYVYNEDWSGLNNLYYRRGRPNSNGTITWSAAEQQVITIYNNVYGFPTVCTDSSGHVWIGYQEWGGGGYYPYVIKSGNNDGTWGTTPPGFPYKLSTTSSGSWGISVIPLTGGKILAIYDRAGATLRAQRWDGSVWGAEKATSSVPGYYSAVASGDDVEVVFSDSDWNVRGVIYSYASNAFINEIIVQTKNEEAGYAPVPVLSRDPASGNLYCFMSGILDNAGWGHITYKKRIGATWDADPTDWFIDPDLGAYFSLKCFYNASVGKIGLTYWNYPEAPRDVRYAYLGPSGSGLYPDCSDTEATIYGAILMIDPLGVRADNKGPICFLMDTMEFSPGITEKSGVMTATLNDNANEKHPDFYLLREGTEFIRDDDEFWAGVQRGTPGVWNPTGGPDGQGSGTKWLMGGYIVNRQYELRSDTKIIATITGVGHEDVWKDMPFGRPTKPRNYTSPTDLATIAYDVLDDVNLLQPDGWRYTRDPSYFPPSAILTVTALYGETLATVDDANGFVIGDALIFDDDFPDGEIVTVSSVDTGLRQINFLTTPITNIEGYHVSKNAKIRQAIIGASWLKEFKQEPAGQVYADICERSDYIWKINYLRQVMLYDRFSAPLAPNIKYESNVRDAPSIVMGRTDDKITHVIVSDGESNTIPSSVDAWSSCQLWFDPQHTPRERDASFAFGPPNPQPPEANSKLAADVGLGETLAIVGYAQDLVLGPALIFDDDFPAGETIIISDISAESASEDPFLITDPTQFSDTWLGFGWSGWYEHLSIYRSALTFTRFVLKRAYMKARMVTNQWFPECVMVVRCMRRLGDAGAWVQFGSEVEIRDVGEIRECIFEGEVSTEYNQSLAVAFQYRLYRGALSTFVTGHQWDSEISGTDITSEWVEFSATPITQAAGYHVAKNATINQSFATANPTYADRSLIFDTKGHPGMCFQNDLSSQFDLNLSGYTNAAGEQAYSPLYLDLREIRRVQFMFRHATRTKPDSTYRIYLKWALNDYWSYDFGRGIGKSSEDSPQETSGDSEHDTVDSSEWAEIDLALPAADEAGVIAPEQRKGWTPVHDPAIPDPEDPNYWKENYINWPVIFIECNEPDPGTGPSQELELGAAAEDRYIKVPHPELFAGLEQGTTVDKFMFNPPICLLQKGATSEEVRIRKIGGTTIPGGCNIELDAPLINNYPLGIVNPTLTTKAGWTISISQFHFEKSIQYEKEDSLPMPPYRYRVAVSKEMEKLNEAVSRADGIIAQEGGSKKEIMVTVDGDPLFEVGMKTRVFFGVDPFQNVGMIIDDATYSIGGGDFSISLLLGTIDRRGRKSDEFDVIQSQQRHIENLGWGKTVMKPS